MRVAVSAVVRWAENTTFVAYLSKLREKQPTPDNKHNRAGRACLTCVTLTYLIALTCAIVSDMDDVMLPLVAMSFSSEHESTGVGWWEMLVGWYEAFSDPFVITSVLLAVLGRAVNYKRAAKQSVALGVPKTCQSARYSNATIDNSSGGLTCMADYVGLFAQVIFGLLGVITIFFSCLYLLALVTDLVRAARYPKLGLRISSRKA